MFPSEQLQPLTASGKQRRKHSPSFLTCKARYLSWLDAHSHLRLSGKDAIGLPGRWASGWAPLSACAVAGQLLAGSLHHQGCCPPGRPTHTAICALGQSLRPEQRNSINKG